MKRSVRDLILLVVLLLCGFLRLSTTLHAQSGPHRDHDGHLEQLVKEIGLDETTQTEVSKILDAAKSQHKQLRQQLREARERMHALLEQAEPDEATVMAHADAVGALETEVRKQRLRTVLQVRALLTPEQRTKLRELLRSRRPRGHHFRHHRFDAPPPPPAQ